VQIKDKHREGKKMCESFETSKNGAECDNCGGSGYDHNKGEYCKECNGTSWAGGNVPEREWKGDDPKHNQKS